MTSFNEEFCGFLEFHLCRTFANTQNPEFKGFWCDGVAWGPLLNENEIRTTAWIGIDGQDPYDMTIKFGPDSLAKYESDESLIDSLPSDENFDWVDVNIKNKSIEIRLK